VADVAIPVLNCNDEHYVLTEWLAADGRQVEAGEPIAVIETSKAASELTCTQPGRLQHLVPAMATCWPGDVVARTLPVQQADEAADAQGQESAIPADPSTPAVLMTNAARELMQRHGLSATQLTRPGMRLIRLADVEAIVSEHAPLGASPGDRLARKQQAVARIVSKSHATIPSAFLALKVPAPWIPGQARADQQPAAHAGVPELVISAVAATASAFPIMFVQVSSDLRIIPAASIDVGVTIDVGSGLTVPVIRHADEKNVTEIAAALLALRVQSMRGKLSDDDLREPCIVVALQQEPGVIVSVPVVYPGNVCAISIGALEWELAMEFSSAPVPRAWFSLGISYDHRVVNGRDAALFLTGIRDRILREATGAQQRPSSGKGCSVDRPDCATDP
jgi:2-oxoglutarate dehydrogenase E2 component (dihydrolipoamide succinyltransferase)